MELLKTLESTWISTRVCKLWLGTWPGLLLCDMTPWKVEFKNLHNTKLTWNRIPMDWVYVERGNLDMKEDAIIVPMCKFNIEWSLEFSVEGISKRGALSQ